MFDWDYQPVTGNANLCCNAVALGHGGRKIKFSDETRVTPACKDQTEKGPSQRDEWEVVGEQRERNVFLERERSG